jgi:hypothetical protein
MPIDDFSGLRAGAGDIDDDVSLAGGVCLLRVVANSTAEIETGKGADALDRRPQLAP